MEFKLIDAMELEFKLRESSRKSKEKKIDSKTRTRDSSVSFELKPIFDESGSAAGYSEKNAKSCREISIDLLFGNTSLAKKLKSSSRTKIVLTTHLTLTSSNTGRLKVETKLPTEEEEMDIFDGLHKLQESLPPNTIEFILSVERFVTDDKYGIWRIHYKERKLDFKEKGLRFEENRNGSFSLEMVNIHFSEGIWWDQWRCGGARFTGCLSLNVKLDMTAVSELYKQRFEKELLAGEVGSPADMVILVGGNNDKKKGIMVHKAILSGMSPVLAAMFQTDMLEAKEGTWEIVDFSEDVIRALIEFAYRRNVEEALKSSEMAVELLEVADKYEMKELKDMLLQIIWSMPFTWFSVDMLIKLVFYAKNAGEDLAGAEKKGWKVLTWYANSYPEKVMESREYVRLCENPQVMMQLGLAVLKRIDSDRHAINW